MRSRDGNRNFSLSVSVVLLLSSLALNASEYLISYRYLVKDATLYSETLQISKAMHKCTGKPYKSIIFENDGSKNLTHIIHQNSDEFITYIHKLGLDVKHKEKTVDFQNSSTTILTLRTKCFKVDFNDNFVRISSLK